MIISHGRKYIFVHIPKTGGTSLALALEKKALKDDILIGDTPKAKNRRGRVKDLAASGRLWKHARLTDIYGVVDQAQIESYFVFTLVRNPWDRMVSYYHWLKVQNFDHPAVGLARELTFSDFLHHPVTIASLRQDVAGFYVQDNTGVDRCNLFLRLEHLGQDLKTLERGIGVSLPEMPKVNVSERRQEYAGYYTKADVALVGSIFQADVTRFDYRF